MGKYLLPLLLIFSMKASADFKSTDEVIKKLSAYTIADIDGDEQRLKDKKPLKIDEMFNDLEETNKYFETNKINEEAAREMERVVLLTLLHDPSGFATELVYPVYSKNVDLFKKAAEKLHPYDRKVILQVLQGQKEAVEHGDG